MEYTHIKKWTRPNCYIGETWYDYYSAGVGQSRDSGPLERANFDAMLARLKAVASPDGDGEGGASVIVVRESHWAVGWVEWIAIHQNDTTALKLADHIKGKLEDYPVIDEEVFSQYEDEECRSVWENCFNVTERIDYFRRHGYTATRLADLLAAIRSGSWYHAANMLHCPSDLI